MDATFRELLRGKKAHVDPVVSLADIPAAMAGKTVAGYPHSVWQIVGHMNYWMDYELRRIAGERPTHPEHAIESWPSSATPANDDEWKRERDRLATLIEKLSDLSESSPAALEALVDSANETPGTPYSLEAVLWQTLVHNSYHAGQIDCSPAMFWSLAAQIRERQLVKLHVWSELWGFSFPTTDACVLPNVSRVSVVTSPLDPCRLRSIAGFVGFRIDACQLDPPYRSSPRPNPRSHRRLEGHSFSSADGSIGRRRSLFLSAEAGLRAGRAQLSLVQGEIDLIGWERDILCFVEVKTRTRHDVKLAEAAVNYDKQRELCGVAREYLRHLRVAPTWRFDVISVYCDHRSGDYQMELFKNAFPVS